MTTAFLLLILYRDSLSYFLSPESDPRPLSITEQNTERNRLSLSEDSTSDSEAPPRRARLRRQLYLTDSEEEEEERSREGKRKDEGEEAYRMVSKPLPKGVKSCIKRPSAPPSPAASSVPLPPLPSSVAEDTPPASPSTRKSVKILDPSSEKASLDAMRELWSTGSEAGSPGNGIAGYRRTRDIYTRGQGGTAVIRGAPRVEIIGSSPREVVAEGEERRESPSQLVIPSTSASTTTRSASLSPSSTSRVKSSPSPLPVTSPTRSTSPAFVVGRSSTSTFGRNNSPSPARMPPRRRTSSKEGTELEGDAISPKWIKSKGGKGVAAALAVSRSAEEDGFEDVSSADVSGASTPVKRNEEPPLLDDLPLRLLAAASISLPDSPKSPGGRRRSLSNESPSLPVRQPSSASNGASSVGALEATATKSPKRRSVVVL